MFEGKLKYSGMNDSEEKNNKIQIPNFKIRLITAIIALLGFGIFTGIQIYNSSAKDFEESYNTILECYNKHDSKSLVIALDEIENFNKNYANDSENITAKVLELYNAIELELYEKSKDEGEILFIADDYIEHYPNGKYIDEIKNAYTTAKEKQEEKERAEKQQQIAENFNNAKEYIENGEYQNAESLLKSIMNNEYASPESIAQAEELSSSIAQQVVAEEGKKAILGTWEKATGVCYTFEEGGHMSVSLNSSYDLSAGNSADYQELKSLLREIEDRGKIIRGGTWEYVMHQDGYPMYRLIHQGEYTCLIKDNSLRIMLSMGIGDISILYK